VPDVRNPRGTLHFGNGSEGMYRHALEAEITHLIIDTAEIYFFRVKTSHAYPSP
jgi:hypothetical protein